jgi:hypothetical protein
VRKEWRRARRQAKVTFETAVRDTCRTLPKRGSVVRAEGFMADKGDSRGKAEARFVKAQRTTDAAKSDSDAKQKAMREKTARLKSARLAKEESDRAAAAEQKALEKPKAAPRKKRAV